MNFSEILYIEGLKEYVKIHVTREKLLITKMQIGHIQELGKEINPDDKFYLGGISTIRGYESRTVSPSKVVTNTDANGVASTVRAYVGGDTEFFCNMELTMPLIKEAGLKGVVFFDVGNSYESASKLFSTVQTSYGAGIRWFSPIGPLRLEYGIPINPRPDIDDKGGRLEFSIGSFF